MKPSLIIFIVLSYLTGCQQLINPPSINRNINQPNQLEQIKKYGSNFSKEYRLNPKKACLKYNRLYNKGDWRAGWILALSSSIINCISTDKAHNILTSLESENRVDPDLIWLNSSFQHLLLKYGESLDELSKQNDELSKLNNEAVVIQDRISILEKENQDLKDKLDALKNIETSISP